MTSVFEFDGTKRFSICGILAPNSTQQLWVINLNPYRPNHFGQRVIDHIAHAGDLGGWVDLLLEAQTKLSHLHILTEEAIDWALQKND